MTNDQLLAAMQSLPDPDLLTPHKIDDPIGAGAYYRADTVARMLLSNDAVLEKAADMLRRLEWCVRLPPTDERDTVTTCPVCEQGSIFGLPAKHDDGCDLASLLRQLDDEGLRA